MNATPRPRATWWPRDLPPLGTGHGLVQRSFSGARLRSAAVALVALGALTVPSSAAALVPLPDPPPIQAGLIELGTAVLALAEGYTEAPLSQQRRLHNEMVLIVNATRSSRMPASARPGGLPSEGRPCGGPRRGRHA